MFRFLRGHYYKKALTVTFKKVLESGLEKESQSFVINLSCYDNRLIKYINRDGHHYNARCCHSLE